MSGKLVCLISVVVAFGLSLATSADAQPAGLVGWWKLDGNANDSSGNNNHGAVVGNPQWVAGQIGGALNFDGVDDQVDCGNGSSLNITGPITISAWIYPTGNGSSNFPRIVAKSNSTGGADPGYQLYMRSADNYIFTISAGGVYQPYSTLTADLNAWNYVACIIDGTQRKLFLNGSWETWNISTLPNSSSNPLVIGNNPGGPRHFQGMIDDVRIYNTALTNEQVEGIMTGKKYPFASLPTPEDGALYTETWVSLAWAAGDLAVSHDVYFSDNFDDVNEGAEAAFRGNQTDKFLFVGITGYPFPDGFVPGTTYYWRIDEVNDADPNSPWVGEVWSFTIPSHNAYEPRPSDGEMFVPTNVTLGWAPGLDAKLHTVYFGDNFDDVNTATVGTSAVSPSFAPGALELNKTYYWRVDELNPPNPTVRGEVWSFTTTLPGLGTAVMQRWENIATTNLDALKNDPRFPNAPDVTETVNEFQWDGEDLSDYGARIEAWLYVPANGDYTFWLATDDQGELLLSTDDDSSNVELIASITGYASLNQWTKYESQKSAPIPLAAGEKYYIAALWKEGSGGDHCQVAWEGPGIPARTIIPGTNLSPYEPVSASGANPANNADGVTQTPVLQWKAGIHAASHDVYFGTDADAVANAAKTAPEFVGTRQLGAESYEPAMLAWNTTYYWRIDEVNAVHPDSPWIGRVWSFTTADYGIVDDFESYNDVESGQPGSRLVYETWVDGFGIPTNGSTMGYAVPFEPTMETGTVHGGDQSAPLEYNNTTSAFSEVVRTFTTAQDWTANGIVTLSLWFYGAGANVPGQLYVKINGVQVNYDGEAGNLAVAGWRPWSIDLTAVNTNLSRVTGMAIGVQGPGATGVLLLDDIRLYSQARELITPVQPDPAGLVAYYEFNQNALDSSGNNNHGTLVGNPPWVQGKTGSAVQFDGARDYVDCGNGPSLNITGPMTISAWIYPTGNGISDFPRIVDKSDGTDAAVPGYKMYPRAAENYVVTLSAGGASYNSSSSVILNTWNHVAFIITGTQWQFELNGAWDQWDETALPSLSGNPLYIGNSPAGDRHFQGIIDDVRIYNRALTPAEAAWLAGKTKPFDNPF